VVVPPTHTVEDPVIGPTAGIGVTVTTFDALKVPQVLAIVYLIVSVPALTPVTTPVALTVAIAGNTLLQLPPASASVRVIELPWQTVDKPAIGLTEFGNTVTEADVMARPQLLLVV
jgi:hypothetical protein